MNIHESYPNHFVTPPIDRNSLERILYPIVPRDITLYWTALTHSSIDVILDDYPQDLVHIFYKNGHHVYGKNYEKLEFLGDSIIHASLAMTLIRMYPDKDEGFLSRVRINIERKSGLAELCNQMGLSNYIKKHPELTLTESMLENVYEGFVGALFEDQQRFLYNGLQRSNEFILRTLRSRFDNIHDIRIDDNFKDTVLRMYDRKVFESIEFGYHSQNKVHYIELTCTYIDAKINYVRTHSYTNADLLSIMNSIPILNIKTKKITHSGRNKREAEQGACDKLMKCLGIRMKRL
jgi:dsRNA-specific ribonuclease